jgi:hypothetical protein
MLCVGKQLYLGAQARTHGTMLFYSARSVASDGHVPGRCSYCVWLQLTHRDTPRRWFWKRALLQTSSFRPINQISCHDPCEKGAAGRGRRWERALNGKGAVENIKRLTQHWTSLALNNYFPTDNRVQPSSRALRKQFTSNKITMQSAHSM